MAKPVAEYLAPRYGYAPDARRRHGRGPSEPCASSTPCWPRAAAADIAYFLGASPTALDLHAAVALATILPLSEAECPMPGAVRHAFETLRSGGEGGGVTRLLEHRAQMFSRHLVLPVRY